MRSRLKQRLRQSPSIAAHSSHRSNASANRSFPRFQIRQKRLVVQSLTTPTPPSCHDPAILPDRPRLRGIRPGFRCCSPLIARPSGLEAAGRRLPTSLTAQSAQGTIETKGRAVPLPGSPPVCRHPIPELTGIAPARPSHSSFVHHRRSEVPLINSKEPVPGLG